MKALCKIMLGGWVALLGLSATDVQGQEKKSIGKGIDPATVAAYEKLGAVYGGWKNSDSWEEFQAGQKHAQQGFPGFKFIKTFPKTKLPGVAVPFGLDLWNTNVTEAELKEIAHLKNLCFLSLNGTDVTDASLRALREIGLLHVLSDAKGKKGVRPKSAEEVEFLYLGGSNITDAGLKELVALKNLVALDLVYTEVTGKGLKDIAALKNLAELSLILHSAQ